MIKFRFVLAVFFLFVLLAANPMSISIHADEPDFEQLVKLALKYDCPMPAEETELAVGWDGSSRPIRPHQDAGIYRPCFVLSKVNEDGKSKSRVLMGFTKRECGTRKHIPAIRKFTLESPDESKDGFTIEHNHLSSFETCIQLAGTGRKELANQLWAKFSKAKYLDGGHPQEGVRALVSKPKLLLARCIFEHYKDQTLEKDADWVKIAEKLEQLRTEFKPLFSKDEKKYNEHYRDQFVSDLSKAVAVDPPAPDSVEHLLLSWNGQNIYSHLGFYSLHNVESDAPAREIFNRGTKAIKPLIQLLNDRRITTHVRQQINNAREYRYRVGDLAKRHLREMAGAQRPEVSDWQPGSAEKWQEWFGKIDLSNEPEFFSKAAFDLESGTAYEVPLRILAERHIDTLKQLVPVFAKNAKPDTYCHYLTYAIRDSKMTLEEKSHLLSILLNELPDKQKRSAVQSLAHINKNLTAELVMPLIEKLPTDVNEPYWKSEAANLTHVVMHLDDVAVWKRYLLVAKKAAVGLRMEIMNPMNYSYINDKNENFRLAFLASFLDDQAIRDSSVDSRFSGPCAAFTFKKISVQDFVTMKLSSMLLKSQDYPESNWSDEQWETRRQKVREILSKRKLPELSTDSDK